MEAIKNPSESEAAGDFGKAAADTADRLATAAHVRVDRAVEIARPAVERAATAAHETVTKVADVATHAAENLAAKTDYLKDAQTQLAEDCRLYLRDHPVKTLGLAALAGFIVSRLLRI
jgi:ElaB/YqjD/DUF883 family membrane-anchored ribosome-binding protein